MEPIAQNPGSGAHLNVIRQIIGDETVISWRALMAFASLDGVLLLHGEGPTSMIDDYVARRGSIDWIIGIDAITTVDALGELRRVQEAYPGQVRVRVFQSPGRSLFHPKMQIFQTDDGEGIIVVGSSNLTRGGLINNGELSAITRLHGEEFARWVDVFEDVAGTGGAVQEITDELLARVSERQTRERPGVRIRVPSPHRREVEPQVADAEAPVLVQLVPRGGGRASQLGIQAQTMIDYFGLREGEDRTIQLQQVQPGAAPGQVEIRPLVFPDRSNRNRRIEVGGLPAVVTEANRPIVVFHHLRENHFRYLVLVPENDGYPQVREYLDALPPGRSMAHDIIAIDILLEIWPDYPV